MSSEDSIPRELREPSRPEVHLASFAIAAVFFQAKEVSFPARGLLALASNFKVYGANLYKLCSNETIEKMLGLNHGPFMRIKKQLRDAGLLDYEGNPGDYTHLKERWERMTGETWRYEL